MKESAARLLLAGSRKGYKDFASIARVLGATDQMTTNWKSRGVSKQAIIKAAAIFGVDAAWLADEPGCIYPEWAAEPGNSTGVVRLRQQPQKEMTGELPEVAAVVAIMRSMCESQRGEVLGYARRVAEGVPGGRKRKRCPVINLAEYRSVRMR